MPTPIETYPQIWIVFCLSGPPADECMHINGIYNTEHDARQHCRPYEGIALVPLGQRFPDDILELDVVYWPWLQNWEETRFYKMHRNAQDVVAKFFRKENSEPHSGR